ncbi:unnamed protein product, partial [Aphanomyces euteiches]
MPIWVADSMRYGKAQTQLFQTSEAASFFIQQGFLTIYDILVRFQGFPTAEQLATCVPPDVVPPQFAKRTALAFLDKLLWSLPCLQQFVASPFPIGPPPPRTVCAASHEWKIATGPIEHCPSRKIYDHLFKYEVPALPIARLAITTTPTAWHWAYEAQLNKHVLPVYADLKFRLQHNALGFLY